MNSYLYAPKDDEKHRAYWRDLYTLQEAADLSHLIKETTKCGIHFIYAISPGLDMTFSSKQEVVLLKKKLDQVRKGGSVVAVFISEYAKASDEFCHIHNSENMGLVHSQVNACTIMFTRVFC